MDEGSKPQTIVRTPHDSPIITVGVALGGVCEGFCGGLWAFEPFGRMFGKGPPIISGLTPLILAFAFHTIRCWTCAKFGSSFLTLSRIAASLIGCRICRLGLLIMGIEFICWGICLLCCALGDDKEIALFPD